MRRLPRKTPMKSVKNSRSKIQNESVALAVLLALAALLIYSAGCTTVVPQTVHGNTASWDAGQQNSGFIGWTNVDHMTFGIITPYALERYNGLISVYGTRFLPPLHPNEGVCTNCLPNLILIQAQDLAHFAQMNRWRKAEATKQ